MTYQPRFAAFLASYGRTDSYANTTAMRALFICDFIPRAMRTAPSGMFSGKHITDHDAFTAHCWTMARNDLLERFPA